MEAADKLAASVAVAPRVTLDDLKAKVMRTRYVVDGSLTICVIELFNGYKLVGKSAPASMANYDVEVGRKFAFEDALNQLWPLEGYVLRNALVVSEQAAYKEQRDLVAAQAALG